MRGFASICAILLALVAASAARAADSALGTDAPFTTQSDSPSSGDGFRAVVTGLRQSLADNGLSQALTRARDWVKELELSWTAHRDERTALGIDTETDTDTSSATANTAPTAAAFAARPYRLNLGLVSFDAGGSEDQVWAVGHTAPLAAVATAGTAADPDIDRRGSAASERSLASHDVELGLRLPMMPWNATVAADHYWWGVRGFGPQVQGSRLALKLSPVRNVEIEGGRAEDTRGTGGFVGVRYSVPLDQSK
ncbi:MAG TPA: hypothetical protein VNF99_00495 [Stellaceae bacterium]|nr:hypothetical protein [Stellaceae bacterium]